MKPLYKLRIFLLTICMIVAMSGCASTQKGISGKATLPQNELPEIMERYSKLEYDPALVRYLKNGDSFYTPEMTHSVKDDEHAISYYDNLLLVFTREDLPKMSQYELESLVDGRVVGVVKGDIHALQILVQNHTLTELYEIADKLMIHESVLYVSSDYPVQIMKEDDNPWSIGTPYRDRGNERYPMGNDWWAEAIGAYTAWEYSDLFGDIKIGIVDDGFLTSHEDLIGQITLVNENSNNELTGHGTHVAGIIGALNNDKGIRGIASHADIYCADMWPEESVNSYHTMLEYLANINYMIEKGVKVINNSWGAYMPKSGDFKLSLSHRMNVDLVPTAIASIVMIAQLLESGHDDLMIVQASGNDGVDARNTGFFARIDEALYNSMNQKLLDQLVKMNVTYTDIDQHILIVGSVDSKRDKYGDYYLSSFSNLGDTVDIAAPGNAIYSTVPEQFGTYKKYSGTSMAAPMVTASVGLLWSIDPTLTVTEIRELLLNSHDILAFTEAGRGTYLYPMLNIGAAVEKLVDNL